MNIEVTQSMFDDVKENYLSITGERLDNKVRSVVMRFKDLPIFNEVVPRWSCQSHSGVEGDGQYYIIFCTVNNGMQELMKLYDRIVDKFVQYYGYGYLAGNEFTIIHLLGSDNKVHKHIKIGFSASGIDAVVERCERIWNEVLDELEKGEL